MWTFENVEEVFVNGAVEGGLVLGAAAVADTLISDAAVEIIDGGDSVGKH